MDENFVNELVEIYKAHKVEKDPEKIQFYHDFELHAAIGLGFDPERGFCFLYEKKQKQLEFTAPYSYFSEETRYKVYQVEDHLKTLGFTADVNPHTMYLEVYWVK